MATKKQIEAAAEILRGMIDAPPSVTEPLIKDALDAAERAAWEPIETAPRDGSWFVACRLCDPNSYEVGCYDPYQRATYTEVEGGLFERKLETVIEWRGFNNMHRMTHWCRLPAPADEEK